MSRWVKEVEDLNPDLIPIMNLFTALIPFLLMSAAFFQVSIIQISVPVASESGETDIAKEEDKITLNMRIVSTGYELSASSDTLPPDELKKLKASIPRTKGTPEAETALAKGITDAAYQIKGKYTASDTVIIVPEEDIPYEDVVFAIDAVRETTLERAGERSRVSLFPRVVLSSIVK